MRPEALFINGVYEDVLEEILRIQSALPEQMLFLQPYTGGAITHLRDDPPTTDEPMRLFVSVTTDLPTIRYVAEIVGWDDKTILLKERRNAISRIIWTLQPGEGGLYDASRVEGAPSVNLLHIRRLRELPEPFGVERLVKTSDNQPLSPGRTTAGGWAYVRDDAVQRNTFLHVSAFGSNICVAMGWPNVTEARVWQIAGNTEGHR